MRLQKKLTSKTNKRKMVDGFLHGFKNAKIKNANVNIHIASTTTINKIKIKIKIKK